MTGALHAGDRGPMVVFVHGVGSTAAIWRHQLSDLSDAYRCYAVELSGNGARKPEAAPHRLSRAAFVDDVLAVADAAGEMRFHFVGCSLGGAVGFELWRRAPERVKSFTFVGSYAAYPNAHEYVRSIEEAVNAAKSMEAFARDRATKLGLTPAREAETVAQMSAKSRKSYLATTRATWTGDYRSALASITVPALVICGERDTIAPLALSHEIFEGITNARLEILENAGHIANADNPAAFNGVLREFLDAQPL